MQPRVQLSSASACCWLILRFPSISIPTSFFVGLTFASQCVLVFEIALTPVHHLVLGLVDVLGLVEPHEEG